MLHSPAAERNRQPILQALLSLLPKHGLALEIASGTGQHLEHFIQALPAWQWLGSDPSEEALASIAERCPNAPQAVQLDVSQSDWHLPPSHQQLDLIYCANMLHISDWSNCAALMRGAQRHLHEQGRLIIYGPFFVPGEATAPSNLDFDADLRRRDPAWGLRSLAAVAQEAQSLGLHLHQKLQMPANNLLLVFQFSPSPNPTQAQP
ncbi:class I SAM-dependent methyltransferase [Paucibacter sp. Y2R2-4]|uniref:class I SAM-dependent methyltransferase n=1 Tax=Paucibacter sp. Y2R2-4 TaxID=2893553 RepID=UPI0021E3959F|nr:class I SAM-dependent methyltransferase [Paucibacter sp. Y2R2-4]MCV2352094.1 class I SAM-dependent methyltransferase [Paucibacter sp. Y2R2-4]